MKRLLTILAIASTVLTAHSQVMLDYSTIEDIVKNERKYFDEIVEIYRSNDPMLRVDDIALVYYGQSFLPQYNPGADANEKALMKFHQEKEYVDAYETAKKIMEYNPVSLNALFNLLVCSKELGKSEEERESYAKKYQGILSMITKYGDGKSCETPFKVITTDDINYVLFHELEIKEVISRKLDPQSMCNIVVVEPTDKFKARRVYFDLSLFLKHTGK